VDWRPVCSAFHLAEYRYVKSPPTALYSCAVLVNGQREWIQYKSVVNDDQDFGEIGKSLDCRASVENSEASVKIGTVGNAGSRLIPMVQAVDHARDWMARHRV
jgi:aminoglycoside 3-N-acetyltransferase